MQITLSTDSKDAVLNALKARIDAGGAAGSIKIYTGTKPAGPGTAITNQVLLGTLALSYPCGAVADGALTFDPITQDSQADATGTAPGREFSTARVMPRSTSTPPSPVAPGSCR